MKFGFALIGLILLVSCSKHEIIDDDSLAYFEKYNEYSMQGENVIACAASDETQADKTFVFFYPVPGAVEIKYYETSTVFVDENDYTNYKLVDLPVEPVFNGYLQRFVRESDNEAWGIVVYKTSGAFHISDPIRIKNKTKPTEWSSAVTVAGTDSVNPKFTWQDGAIKENVIYFEVVTDANNKLLSGTYTTDKFFEYYKLNNVTLNITRETPPEILPNNTYRFTMMGVSEDNWVNLVLQKQFTTTN